MERYPFRLYDGRAKPKKQGLLAEAHAHLEYVLACLGELAVGRSGVESFVRRSGIKPLHDSDLSFCVAAVYEYAYNARWYRDWDLDLAWGKVYSLHQMSLTLDEFGGFDIVVDFPETNDLGWMITLAMIRAKLDWGTSEADTFRVTFHDQEINVDDLAALSGLALGSVRNATSAKGEGRLATVRRGKEAYIEPAEALRWLRTRPGFVETKLIAHKEMLDAVTENGAIKVSESPEWQRGHLTREKLQLAELFRKLSKAKDGGSR